MLRYAAELNNKLDGAEIEAVEKITRFFVETEIAPIFEELRAASEKPSWKWMKRSMNYLKISPEVVAAYLTSGKLAAIAAAIRGVSSTTLSDVTASRTANKTIRQSGLYYLLKIETKT